MAMSFEEQSNADFPAPRHKRPLFNSIFICLFLAAITLIVYWPVRNFDFVDYDDPAYFSANRHVLGGLTAGNIRWAFTTGDAANWHPLTWLSLMLDAEWFGSGPAGPHLVNLLFHIASSILLFLLLRRMTGSQWRSAVVAALFALHPLHVESVAWIAERKDVLSAFFGLAALIFYAEYAATETPRRWWFHGFALLSFALGLMSKSMLVTLPFVMLLLDFWPLRRFSVFGIQNPDFAGVAGQPAARTPKPGILLLEKLPFIVLTAAACAVTYLVQQKGGAICAMTEFPMPMRIENAFVSYARYLGKTFWPVALAAPYPHPGWWPPLFAAFSVALFPGICVAAVLAHKKYPFVFTGWFWFAGMLVPVIGLVQVGSASMADRYAYMPLIGIFIAVVWGAAEFLRRWQISTTAIFVIVTALLGASAARTRDQAEYWRNDETLFSHALAVTRNNYVASINYGAWLSKNSKTGAALQYYHQALRMAPDDPTALYDAGNAFARLGYWDEAIRDYRHALQAAPVDPDILDNLGFALAQKKQFAEAAASLESALQRRPKFADAHNNLAAVLFAEGQYGEAARHFYEAVKLRPEDPAIWNNLGDAFLRLGKTNVAIGCYQQTLRLEPDNQKVRAKWEALAAPRSD